MKKYITTRSEKKLSNLVYFRGKTIKSLVLRAQLALNSKETQVAALLKVAKKQDRERRKAAAAKLGLTVKSHKALAAKVRDILSDFHTSHSMGCYRSAYIQHKGKFLFLSRNDTLATYANSCTWSETYGNVSLNFTKKELRSIQKIEGLWTIVNSDGTAKWLQETGRKQHYEVSWVEGFVFGSTHSTISLAEAIAGETKKLAKILEAIKDDARFIGIQHIRKTGACQAGIDAYCHRHKLDQARGYNLGYLKSLENSKYFNRIEKF